MNAQAPAPALLSSPEALSDAEVAAGIVVASGIPDPEAAGEAIARLFAGDFGQFRRMDETPHCVEGYRHGDRWHRELRIARNSCSCFFEALAGGRRAYESLQDFYGADRRRKASREVDFGVWWRERAGDPALRLTWAPETGELFLVSPVQAVTVIARIPAADEQPAPGPGVYYRHVDEILDGWADSCGSDGCLSWLAGRLAARGFAA